MCDDSKEVNIRWCVTGTSPVNTADDFFSIYKTKESAFRKFDELKEAGQQVEVVSICTCIRHKIVRKTVRYCGYNNHINIDEVAR